MASDSNSPSDERTAGPGSDRLAASALKLVSERGAGTAAAGSAPHVKTDGMGDVKSGAGVGPAPVHGEGGTLGRKLPLWLFVVLFVLFLIGYGYQTQQAGRLQDEVARLETSLARAEGRLESHRTHLLEIRGGVHDLSSRLEDLRVLIDRDPTAEVAPMPAPADSAAPAEPAQP